MFEQILSIVKEHIGNDPQVVGAIPATKVEEVHHEIAGQLKDGLKHEANVKGGVGELLSSLTGSIANNPMAGAISGSIITTLGNKFGLSPAITGAIAGAIPGILEKFAHKANDPTDQSLTPDSISKSLSKDDGLGRLLKGL